MINTMMLNYIALRMTDWLIRSKTPYILGDPADTTGARSRLIVETARLPRIQGKSATILPLGIPLALVLVFVVAWLLYRTTLGFEMRTAGTNPHAARYAGINVPRTMILAMAIAGSLAGIAGAIEGIGVRSALSADFFSGLGFDAIAGALLARAHPVGIICSGLLWGGLLISARLMQVRARLSIDVTKMVQALI